MRSENRLKVLSNVLKKKTSLELKEAAKEAASQKYAGNISKLQSFAEASDQRKVTRQMTYDVKPAH